jgi:hypothetical protein
LPLFTKRWNALGLDDEGDLTALQLLIMANPTAAPAIRGANGIRKMRFAPPRWNTGKSGATRVLYVYYEQLGIVVLALIYAKGEADNISEAGKARLSRLVTELEIELRKTADE